MKLSSPDPIRQKGAALLALMLVMVVSGSAYYLTAVNSRMDVEIKQRQEVLFQLQAAKQALLSYTANSYKLHGDRGYGYMPCPDLKDNISGSSTPDGMADASCSTSSRLGLLPQKVEVASGTFEISSALNNPSERLWYAVSTNVMHTTTSNDSIRRSSSKSTGTANLFTLDGRADYVALIIAPGEALGTQDHTISQTAYAQYLDDRNGSNKIFTRYGSPDTFNDIVIGITHDEYMQAIGPAIARDFRTAALAYASGFPKDRLNLFYSVYYASIPVAPPGQAVLPPFYYYGSSNPTPEYWALWVYYQNNVSYSSSGGDESLTFAFNECDNMLFTYSRDSTAITRTGDTCL